jgi:O-antigen/teichoic acid export membrane protein
MLPVVSRIFKKDIVKVFSWNAISTFVRMLTGFISVKVVAVLIGPAGVALLGQLNNFSAIFLMMSSGGINSGVTKYIAEYKDSKTKIVFYLRTAFWITVIFSLISGLLLVIGSDYFSILILKNVKYKPIFLVFGCTIIFYSLNGLLLSIINGFKEFKKYVAINIISSFIGLLFSSILALYFGVFGALLSAVTFQSVVFIVTISFACKSPWFKKHNFIGKFSKISGGKLAHYSLMALVSAITLPVSQLIIRSFLVEHSNLNEAGLWEGMNRISNMYLTVVTTSLSIYYLPRLAEIKDPFDLRNEIVNTSKIFLPPLIIISLTIYIFRNNIIHLLFNERFEGMQNLFVFQLIGDFLKISSWILAYQMVAKSMTKTFVTTEIIFCGILIGLTTQLIKIYGNIGATIGYACTYFLYFISMCIIFRRLLFNKVNSQKN